MSDQTLRIDTDRGRLVVPVHVRWSDLDPWGHVNNVAMMTLLEESRIAALWQLGRPGEISTNVLPGGPHAPVQTVVVHQEIEYREAVRYTGFPLMVEMWCAKLAPIQAEVCYEVPGDRGPAVLGSSTIVPIDATNGRPQRFSPEAREAWKPFLGERPPFRRR